MDNVGDEIKKSYFKFIEKGKLKDLEKLIEENNININTLVTPNGNTGLMYAIYFKKKDIAGYFMKAGADIAIENTNKETARDLAKGNSEFIDILEKRRLFY